MFAVSCFGGWLIYLRLIIVVSSVFGGFSVYRSNDRSTNWVLLVVPCWCVSFWQECLRMVYLAGMVYLAVGQ